MLSKVTSSDLAFLKIVLPCGVEYAFVLTVRLLRMKPLCRFHSFVTYYLFNRRIPIVSGPKALTQRWTDWPIRRRPNRTKGEDESVLV